MIRKTLKWLRGPQRRALKVGIVAVTIAIGLYLLVAAVQFGRALNDPRSQTFLDWAIGGDSDRQALVLTQRESCPGAPFILPADGFIGLLYADTRGPYSRSTPHQGIDIFSNAEPGQTPVYAAYDGYITREDDWVSTLIQRVPQDPLQPERQIWLYYTHMADRQGDDFIEAGFPPGTREIFVEQGTLLGYTGDYNGLSARSIWVHLHFSIVQDDGSGRYLNELDFANSVDPSPYLGLPVHKACATADDSMACSPTPVCTR